MSRDEKLLAWPDGLRLNRLIAESTMTLKEVADRSGVSVSTIIRAVSGKQAIHRPNLAAILRAIGRTEADLRAAEPRTRKQSFNVMPKVFDGVLGRVYAWLADYYAEDRSRPRPPVRDIAKSLGISEKYVSDCCRRLREAGVIRMDKRPSLRSLKVYEDYKARGEVAYAGL